MVTISVQSSMGALTRLILFSLVYSIKASPRPHGEKCVYDGDCKYGLTCALEDKLFNPQRICQCPPELSYINGQCEKEETDVAIAEILAILIPVISSVIITIIVILGCCCWIHSSNLNIEKAAKQKAVEEKEEPPEFELKEVSIDRSSSSKSVKTAKRKRKVPKVPESTEENESTNTEDIENPVDTVKPKISVISDPGYQANMKYLLRRPHSTSHLSNGINGINGLLTSRPNSANFYNLDSRPSSALKQNSRSSSASSRKSSALNGPYLTEPMIRPSRPRPFSSIQNGQVPNGQIQNGQALYENILAVVEADDKKDNTKIEQKASPKSNSIEEIKLVRVAVSAFKKKKRLKDLKKGPKKKTNFASVVEKVMHLRAKEDKRFYTARSHRKKSLSSSTTSTTSAGSSGTKASRPESVAQRVQRERQEKRINARNVVTPPKKKNSKKVKEPLHLALRKSASKHGPRAVMAQKIKQQAHFNAVSEFQVNALLKKKSVE